MRYERVYIAGKITGDTGYREKFKEAEQRLEKDYKWNWWCIVNPVREVPEKWPWWRQRPTGGRAVVPGKSTAGHGD